MDQMLKKNANGGDRKRNPLSDCTNSNTTPRSNLSSTFSSSSAFHKFVTRCVLHSRRHASDERKTTKKKVAVNLVSDTTTIPKISKIREKSGGIENLDLPKIKPLKVLSRKKQRAASYEPGVSKDAQLQDFIEKQRAYFKEVDEFKLLEEEVKSIYELD